MTGAGHQPITRGSSAPTCSTRSSDAGARSVVQKGGLRWCQYARCAAASAQSHAGAASWGGGVLWARKALAVAAQPVLALPELAAERLQAETLPNRHTAPAGVDSQHLQPQGPANRGKLHVSTASRTQQDEALEVEHSLQVETYLHSQIQSMHVRGSWTEYRHTCGCKCCKLSCASMDGGRPKNGKPCGGHACICTREESARR